ncbi:iron-regulated membrane protein [Pseudomonas sp. XWY-1]|nr:iron-regulated membrane protein [Pseudomonas sp. XWY-1]
MRIEIIIIAAFKTPGPRHDAQNRWPSPQLSPGRDIP